MLQKLLPFLLVALLSSCADDTTSPTPPANSKTIQPAPNGSVYWSWDGQTRVLLIGGTKSRAPFLDEDFKLELTALRQAGGNYVNIFLPTMIDSTGFAPFLRDFDAPPEERQYHFLPEYWTALQGFLDYAAEMRLAVEIDPWDRAAFEPEGWSKNVFNYSVPLDSVKVGRPDQWLPGEHPFFQTVPGSIMYHSSLDGLRELQELFLDKLLETTLPYRNVIYNVDSETTLNVPWTAHWGQYIERAAAEAGRTVFVRLRTKPVVPTRIADFNARVLAGQPIAHHPAPPYGNGGNGAALASLRGIRVVERHLKFWDLRPAPELLLEENSLATAAKDGKGNYLIYLPSAGGVTLSPDWTEQRPVKVTVVGYLGTQRSETLQPPYGDSFRMYTEEEKGGWMILEPEG